jgi:thiosulfate/3-mercaptopyruvate sulfurtransferase
MMGIRRGTIVGLSMVLGLVLLAGTAPAAGPGAVVDTAYVNQALARGVTVWDVRDAQAYRKGHIPGAVNIGFVGDALRNPQSEDYLPVARLEALLGGAGIDPFKEVIVYGGKADPYVYFAAVTIRYLGGDQPRIYHGGIDDWMAAKQSLSTGEVKLPPVSFKARLDPRWALDTPTVRKKIGDPSVQIVDVRTPAEYTGQDIRALRGGHIPGAVNIPYEQNWKDPAAMGKLARREITAKDGLDLKSADELRALYARLDPNKETIVYCQSGVRASETAEILQGLGFKDVKVYDPSWLGYGNTLDAPAESVTYFNVGATNARIRALESRIEALEKALKESKGAR